MILTIFFISLAVLATSLVLAVLNMAASTRSANFDQAFLFHVILIAVYGIAGLATLVTGVIWAVQYISDKL